jgi:hypothetical protein
METTFIFREIRRWVRVEMELGLFFICLTICGCTWPQQDRLGNEPNGKILIVRKWLPDITVSAVATGGNPTEREKKAVDEIRKYLRQMTGADLKYIVITNSTVPEGVIAVGPLARSAGLIALRELDKVKTDGYVVKISSGRVAICGWRDLGTVYGAYDFLTNLGVRFYAPENMF